MKENGHWYDRSGNPQHFVAKKDGSGNRPTTLADARKNGWLPSVTTILRVLDKPALTKWKVEQACMAVLTSPRRDGEELDAFMQRVLYEDCEQDQEAAQAADRGTEMHAALESLFKGEDVADTSILPWVLPAFQAVSALGKTAATEMIVVGDRYAGKFDLMQKCPNQNGDALRVWDFKTTKKLPTKGAWNEHIMQCAMYARAMDTYLPITTGNVYISTVNQGEFVVCEHGDWRTTYEQACEPLVRVWQYLNDYRP